MARMKRILEFTASRRPGQSVGGPLMVNFDSTEAEKREAFNSLLAATLKVAGLWKLDDVLKEAAEAIVRAKLPQSRP